MEEQKETLLDKMYKRPITTIILFGILVSGLTDIITSFAHNKKGE